MLSRKMTCRTCEKEISGDQYFCNDVCKEKFGLEHYGPAARQITGTTKAFLLAKIEVMRQGASKRQKTGGASIQEIMSIFGQ